MFEDHEEAIQQFRHKVRDKKRVATCLGFGPRFLHSTGQDYKGGPNTGVFLQLTADHADDVDIPGQSYSFGIVIDAQAAAIWRCWNREDGAPCASTWARTSQRA